MPLNVMVLESENGVADKVADDLTTAGHVVLRCHEAGAPAFPCVGVADQAACPLHAHAVDGHLELLRIFEAVAQRRISQPCGPAGWPDARSPGRGLRPAPPARVAARSFRR